MTTRTLNTGADDLLCSVTNHVATITLNNPEKRNAFSETLTPALRRMLDETEADPDVRVLVITGAGGGFCAGGDISGMGAALSGGSDRPDADAMIARLQQAQETISLKLYEYSKPTIAALPGAAAGAGMSLALAADMRIATDSAFLTSAFAKIGLSGDFGGSWLLTNLIGPGRAKEIYYTSRRITSDEAHALGLFNRVVPETELVAETTALANQLAASAPIALRYMKENLNRAAVTDLRTALKLEADRMIRTMLTEDHKQAAQAFMEKRAPVFKGN